MSNILDILEQATTDILEADISSFSEDINLVINEMMKLLPEIIQSYSLDKMQDVASDATYWPQQVEKILGLVKKDDRLAIADALYCELRANLVEYKKLCFDRNIECIF